MSANIGAEEKQTLLPTANSQIQLGGGVRVAKHVHQVVANGRPFPALPLSVATSAASGRRQLEDQVDMCAPLALHKVGALI